MNKALLALALGMALAACDPPPRPLPNHVLVCAIEGKETFRSSAQESWHLDDGSWKSDYYWPPSAQYQPSMYESCHTERI